MQAASCLEGNKSENQKTTVTTKTRFSPRASRRDVVLQPILDAYLLNCKRICGSLIQQPQKPNKPRLALNIYLINYSDFAHDFPYKTLMFP